MQLACRSLTDFILTLLKIVLLCNVMYFLMSEEDLFYDRNITTIISTYLVIFSTATRYTYRQGKYRKLLNKKKEDTDIVSSQHIILLPCVFCFILL